MIVSLLSDKILYFAPFIFLSIFTRFVQLFCGHFEFVVKSLIPGMCHQHIRIYRKGVSECQALVKVFQLFHVEFKEDVKKG